MLTRVLAAYLTGFHATSAVTREVVLLVLLVVALEPHPLRVALRREDVRGDAIEEEAVMTHDDHAAGELEQRLDR